jgi:hypothetical protein
MFKAFEIGTVPAMLANCIDPASRRRRGALMLMQKRRGKSAENQTSFGVPASVPFDRIGGAIFSSQRAGGLIPCIHRVAGRNTAWRCRYWFLSGWKA